MACVKPRLLAATLSLSALLVCAAARAVCAEAIDAGKAAKVKTAYLLNFVRYTQWPDTSFNDPASPIFITLVGQCDVADVLAEIVKRNELIEGRALAISETQSDDLELLLRNTEGAHLVYVCSLAAERVHALLQHLETKDVLTVGDIPEFAENGGMLGFVLRGDRIIFEANLAAIQASHVTVSAKVLKLAQIAETREKP